MRSWLILPVLVLAGCGGGRTSSSTAPPPAPASTGVPGSSGASQPTTAATAAVSPGSTRSSPTSSRAAASAVAEAGLGCRDFRAETPDPANIGPTATEGGVCTVEGTKLAIGGYTSSTDAEAAFAAAQTLGCRLAKDTVNGTAVVVAGPVLLGLQDGNVGVSERIASAVAGQVRILRCA